MLLRAYRTFGDGPFVAGRVGTDVEPRHSLGVVYVERRTVSGPGFECPTGGLEETAAVRGHPGCIRM